jgi:hypothetical protein
VIEASDLTGEAWRTDWFWPVFGGTISYSATHPCSQVIACDKKKKLREPEKPSMQAKIK